MPRSPVVALLLALSVVGTARSQIDPAEGQHRAEAIRRYEALVNDPSPGLAGRRDELMFRLALLYLEEGQAASATRGLAVARDYHQRSLRLFDQVLTRRDTVFREDALYYRAIVLQEMGQTEDSTAAFRTLLREFPASARSAELWFRVGNDAVQKNRLQEALAAYEEVLKRTEPTYRDQAAYMFAWTASALHQEARSRTTLLDLLQRLETGGQQQGNLYPEAIELLAKVIRSEGNPSVLSGPWIGPRPAFARTVLRRVADLFRETSAFGPAAATYEQFLREYPDEADVDAVEKTTIECWLKAGEAERAEAARTRLIQRHLAGTALRAESVAEIAPVVKDSALYLHHQARAAHRPDLFQRAVQAYQLYAASVAPGPQRAEAIFFQADALKEMGDLSGAAERYHEVATSNDPTHGEEAAFRRIVLLEDLKQKGSASADQVLAAYEDYFRLYPTGKSEAELRVRSVAYLFDEKRFAETLAAGGAAVGRISDPAARQKTKMLLARSAFAANDFLQSANWASQLLAEPNLSPDLRREGEEVHVAALYKAAEGMKDRAIEAAAQYDLLATRYPKHKTAPAALYNGAILLRDAGEKARALTLFRRLIDSYPQSELRRDATVAATDIHRELGDAAGASSLLEHAARGAGSASESSEYLYQAAVQAQTAGSHARTMELFRKFLQVHPANDVRAAQARLAIAKAHWAVGQSGEAERVALQALEKMPIGVGEEAQRVQVMAAEARLLLGDAALRRFDSVRIVDPVAANLKKKQTAMDEALTELRQAAAFGFADISLASYYKIGYAQLDFANAVMQAPRPKNLSMEQLGEYDVLLREQVSPYRSAAEQAFRTALEQGTTAGVENEWTARARVALASITPLSAPGAVSPPPPAAPVGMAAPPIPAPSGAPPPVPANAAAPPTPIQGAQPGTLGAPAPPEPDAGTVPILPGS